MPTPQAIILDLGHTLVEWSMENEALRRAWAICCEARVLAWPDRQWPESQMFMQAIRAAEDAYWQRAVKEHGSGPPSEVIREEMRRLRYAPDREALSDSRWICLCD